MKKMMTCKQAAAGTHDRGSALILVLGVLALLLISATTFVFTANTERQASAMNADVTKARLMARGKMEEAVAYLYYYCKSNTAIYPGTSTLMGQGTGDWTNVYHVASNNSTTYATDLDDAFHIDYGFNYTPATITGMAGTPSWQLIKDNDNTIVGRVAYLVIDESGKLDPNYLINPTEPFFDEDGNGMRQSTAPSEYYYDWDSSGSYTNAIISEGSEKRYGYSPSEINMNGGIKTRLGISTLFSSADNFATRRNSGIPKWFSWTQMVKANYNGKLFTGMDAGEIKSLKNVLFPRSFDKQAYRSDGKDYQRLPVGTFNWNTATVAGLQATPGVLWTASGSTAASMPWLAALKATTDVNGNGTAGEAADDTALRNQVAANIIDYCDSDDHATNDYGSGDTYCGLEKVPYINEVGISFAYQNYSDNGTTADPSDDTAELVLNGFVEMINIYGAGLFLKPSEVTLNVTGYFDDAGATESTLTFTGPAGPGGNFTGYHVIEMGSKSVTVTGDVQSLDRIRITKIEVVYSAGPGNMKDYAIITTPSAEISLVNGGAEEAYCSTQTYDPRCNTVDSMWTWSGGDLNTTNSLLAGTGTLSTGASYDGKANACSNPKSADAALGYGAAGTAYDTETATDPAGGISTAYIRDAPMKSLWELGAISRGEPWRTINLLKYNGDTTSGIYANGDAILLDQCCVGPGHYVSGRFNVNSPLQDDWYALLYGIKVGTGYGHNTPATGSAITPTNLAGIVSSTSGTNALTSRGQVAAIAQLKSQSASQTTNATKEEVIGKIANLLTTRQNYFRVLVTAQVVKDLGDVPDSIPAASHPASWTKLEDGHWLDVLAEVKKVAIVYRDAFTNTFKIEEIRSLE